MFYIYILYSKISDMYYVGYTNNPERRLKEHNTSSYNTFTSKHRPWKLITLFECGSNERNAIRIERFIKKQKSKKLLKLLCDFDFTPSGFLAQLVRVPDIRD